MRSLLTAVLLILAAVLLLPGPVEAKPATWNALTPVIDKTWDKSRWQRGQPKAKVIRFYRRSLVRAASEIDRKLIKHRWRKSKRLYYRHRSYCRSGAVYEGRVSYFDDGVTASGMSAAYNAGLAINPVPGTGAWNSPLTQSWMTAARNGRPVYVRVWVAGKSGVFPIIDVGPHSSVGRALDFSGPAVDALGLSRAAFPTDSWGTAKVIPAGC